MKLKKLIRKVLSKYSLTKFPPSVDITCNTETHGDPNYGAWTLCPDHLDSNSIVYAIGVGEDISFDLSLISKFGLQVYAFDPTPKSVSWLEKQNLPPRFHFYSYGLSDKDGMESFYPPENDAHVSHTLLLDVRPELTPIQLEVHRLSSIMSTLGHSQIDVLKLDIEGAEYRVIEDIFRSKEIRAKQILVEFHHRFNSLSQKDSILAITRLQKLGYKLYFISKTKEEFSFIRD